jgi:hypothetical protein
MSWKSLKDFKSTDIDLLLHKVPNDHLINLRELLETTCNEHFHIFEYEFFKSTKDNSNVNYIAYILPAVRKVYFEVFIKDLEIFKESFRESEHNLKCLELFRLNFNLEEFLKYFAQKLIDNHDKLDDLEFLDGHAEILNLIVSNYVAGLLRKSRISNPTKEIRNIKIERDLKIN